MSPATMKPGWCDTLNTRNLNFLFLVAFLSFFIVLIVAVPVESETEERNASFTGVTYSARIPVDTKDTWSFTIYNSNCTQDGQGGARFFLIFYADNEQWLNEYNGTQYRTWSCNESSSVTHKYSIREWQAIRPTSHEVRVELYWEKNGTFRLEDTTSFTVDVVVHIALQHIFATGYFAAYLIVCFVLFSYVYIQGLND
jgi:hypothetical protein